MKKYLFGLSAILLAVGAVAFTRPPATFTFKYDLTTYTQAQVQSISNWSLAIGPGCDGTDRKACQIEVEETYTHLEGSTRVLNTTGNVISITASLYIPDGTYYVSSGIGIVGIINSQ
jgi:hypothetical protein